MQPTPDEVYKQIDNALYNEQGDTWWDESQCLHLLKSSVNPVSVGYFRKLLDQVLKLESITLEQMRLKGLRSSPFERSQHGEISPMTSGERFSRIVPTTFRRGLLICSQSPDVFTTVATWVTRNPSIS